MNSQFLSRRVGNVDEAGNAGCGKGLIEINAENFGVRGCAVVEAKLLGFH